MSLDELTGKLSQKFIFVEEIAKTVFLGRNTGQAILWWGPGGHAKTEIAAFSSQLYYPPSEVGVQVFGTGTLKANVFGGLDVKAFQTEGDMRYFLERSEWAKKCFIMEELLDAPPPILEYFKYAMQAKKFPNGVKGAFDITVEMYICSTNREPVVWAMEDKNGEESRRAVLGRFPIRHKVAWPAYNTSTFVQMLDKVFGPKHEYHPVAEIAGLCHTNGVKVSPRDVVKLCGQYDQIKDLSIFNFVEEVAANDYLRSEISRMSKSAVENAAIRVLVQRIGEKLKNMPKPGGDRDINLRFMGVLQAYEKRLAVLRPSDELTGEVNSLIKNIRERIVKYQEAVASSLSLTPEQFEEWKI